MIKGLDLLHVNWRRFRFLVLQISTMLQSIIIDCNLCKDLNLREGEPSIESRDLSKIRFQSPAKINWQLSSTFTVFNFCTRS